MLSNYFIFYSNTMPKYGANKNKWNEHLFRLITDFLYFTRMAVFLFTIFC